MGDSLKQNQVDKAIRLVEYLLRLASLRTKLIRDIAEYDRTLWVSDIPRVKGCFTQAWGRDEEIDSDVWVEVQNQREPELPSVPDLCQEWVVMSSLRNKNDLPKLLPEITRPIEDPWGRDEENEENPKHSAQQPDLFDKSPPQTEQSEFIAQVQRLEDHPEVQETWDGYVEERWLPWAQEHNAWESVHRVYSALFAIHQEQVRLGEEYELILGLGLLTWQTPSGQRVLRHLIVANALLEFEARPGKFTVRPMPDGASLRPELDMLDIEEQPARAEEVAKSSLANAGDDPWEKDCIEGVLQALVHSINAQGDYDNTLESKNVRASAKPIVEYAPALILRKRSAKGLTETLKRIKERIEKGEDIPTQFADLAEIRPIGGDEPQDDPGETSSEFDGEVFFPKRSNEEQRRIVDKIRAASGVLVQGPPGTGKSHTIANLICHLLATGNRILVTAKTPRALQVLLGKTGNEENRENRNAEQGKRKDDGLIPTEIRSLCINLLGRGHEEKTSLGSSVDGILRKNEEWNELLAAGERGQLGQELRQLREEKARVERRLREIRESETHTHSIAEGTYRGTAARIAEAVNRDRSVYGWFPDVVNLEEACPISENNFRSLLAALRHFTLEKRHELSLSWPDTLPSSQRLAHLVECEKRAIEEETRLTRGANEHLADLLSKSHVTVVEAIHNALSTFLDMRRRLSATHHLWIHDALRDVLSGNPALWQELYRVTRDAIDSIEALVPVADDNSIDLPDEANIKRLREDVLVLKEHMHNGGKLGWGPFRQKLVKERICVLKTVRVNGQAPANLEYLSVLADALLVRIETEKAWGFWIGRCEKSQGPYGLQLPALKGLCDSVDGALSVGGLIEKCRESLQQCPHIGEPLWPDEVQIEQLVASCRLALARHGKRLAVEEIRNIEAPLASITAQNNAHTIVRELLLAIRNRDVEGFAQCWNTMRELEKDRQRVQKVDEYVSQLRRLVPKLTAELDRTCADPCWEERAQHIHSAWHWAQARFWVEEYIRKDDALSLSNRANQIEDKINEVIVKLAALHAWSFCISRLTKHHCRHMEAWRKHVGSLSKTGRGKRDFRNRQAAQRSLNECKDAVPAWVMPLHRVWDTVDPAPGMFDIVIVDEASQCGYEALPLLYLCKRILIVGDDKQISPGGEFQDTTPINRYLDVYLYDFSFREFFDVNVSLFALGKLLYGTRKIALREHFRCMPEIIRFSNDLCYSDTPLIPLRQYGPDRLRPLEHVFVSGGYREGSGDRVVNQPEAEAVVAKIVELCRDARYSKKTMGVVVLQGEAQGGLIEGQLLERLGAEEMDRRRLVCGNPYSFQGDERDIMFLSMVAAPNERIGPLTKAADERRFNVAASRARDQMWLFHSVTCDDLSTTCLRRRLLEFFQNTKPQQVAGIDRDELERRASQDNRRVVKPPKPFESWFEVDVALELVRKGFNVRPQYEVAGKRIDLVIEGGQARLAVECDGDEWHGAEQYEADMQRQRQLERCGWEFFRVRESAFYSNKDEALKDLWRLLEERGIFPRSPFAEENPDDDEEEEVFEESYSDETEDNGENLDCDMPPRDDSSESSGESGRRVQEVTASEIQDAICQVLSDCPNQSCTEKSLAARVLRELGVLTRGNPRVEFEKRVLRCVTSLERRSVVEKYRAKNRRVRLLNP